MHALQSTAIIVGGQQCSYFQQYNNILAFQLLYYLSLHPEARRKFVKVVSNCFQYLYDFQPNVACIAKYGYYRRWSTILMICMYMGIASFFTLFDNIVEIVLRYRNSTVVSIVVRLVLLIAALTLGIVLNMTLLASSVHAFKRRLSLHNFTKFLYVSQSQVGDGVSVSLSDHPFLQQQNLIF